jgi:GDPmannose 4,6-dehydratase
MKRALITGISGQDGSYLAEFLLRKGYEVYGMVRRSSTETFGRIEHIRHKISLQQADLFDQLSVINLLKICKPHEVYNLAGQSFVPTSWAQPSITGTYSAIGVTKLLEAIRLTDPAIKFYQASCSEMFGKVRETPQDENTPFSPRSPIGIAKLFGHNMTVSYREQYKLFCVSGILFNHESPRRGQEFVSRRISETVARIKLKRSKELHLGNLDAHRDWGFAGDYVKAMWMMLQQEEPDDFIIATGKTHSVREFVEMAFKHVGLNWEKYVTFDKSLHRASDVNHLRGNAEKAKRKLGWKPEVTFKELVHMMVDADIERLRNEG